MPFLFCCKQTTCTHDMLCSLIVHGILNWWYLLQEIISCSWVGCSTCWSSIQECQWGSFKRDIWWVCLHVWCRLLLNYVRCSNVMQLCFHFIMKEITDSKCYPQLMFFHVLVWNLFRQVFKKCWYFLEVIYTFENFMRMVGLEILSLKLNLVNIVHFLALVFTLRLLQT
jgi:hypothetical protein